MAKRLLRWSCPSSKSLAFFMSGARPYSSRDSRFYSIQPSYPKPLEIENEELWMKSTLGCLAPVNKRFPFPGSVGPLPVYSVFSTPLPALRMPLDHLLPLSGIDQYESVLQECPDFTSTATSESADVVSFEYVAYECPTLLKRELHELYSHLSALRECNTVILARKRVPANSQEQGIDITENCEQDRSFISAACKVCAALTAANHWSDFVEPSSGDLFLSGSNLTSIHGKITLPRKPLSTQYGFDIVRHGSCRVMGPFKSHKRRHQFAFAGYFVTVAPRDHPVIVKLTGGKGV